MFNYLTLHWHVLFIYKVVKMIKGGQCISLIFNSLTFYWHLEVSYRVVMTYRVVVLLQGDQLFNIDFFNFTLACFVHNHGGQEHTGLPSHL